MDFRNEYRQPQLFNYTAKIKAAAAALIASSLSKINRKKGNKRESAY
jgi:hypothetical protein